MSRVDGATSGRPRSDRETVAIETPARFATSSMLAVIAFSRVPARSGVVAASPMVCSTEQAPHSRHKR